VSGRFITLEGLDGAGKSTHAPWLAERLRAQGREVVLTREPGGTPLGDRLRELLLHQAMDLRTETLLMFAARQEHLAQVILPSLAAGKCVLCDRFTDATFAYQGRGRGLPLAKIETLEEWVQEGLQPELTFFFDLSAEAAQARRRAAGMPLDRFEEQDLAFHRRVRDAYLARARQNPARFRIIDASGDFADVRKRLEETLSTF
jgi:dTMP kinase